MIKDVSSKVSGSPSRNDVRNSGRFDYQALWSVAGGEGQPSKIKFCACFNPPTMLVVGLLTQSLADLVGHGAAAIIKHCGASGGPFKEIKFQGSDE